MASMNYFLIKVKLDDTPYTYLFYIFYYLKSTCDVNLLSKLSIIFKEWRVVNNMYRGGARV
jgi:hypothetical protein